MTVYNHIYTHHRSILSVVVVGEGTHHRFGFVRYLLI